jgi:hypothetical protein
MAVSKAGIEVVDVGGRHMICFDEASDVSPEVWNLDTAKAFVGLHGRYAHPYEKQSADDLKEHSKNKPDPVTLGMHKHQMRLRKAQEMEAIERLITKECDQGWGKTIKDAAEDKGFDCTGLSGIAIVHALADVWLKLRGEVQAHRDRRERELESLPGAANPVQLSLAHRVMVLEYRLENVADMSAMGEAVANHHERMVKMDKRLTAIEPAKDTKPKRTAKVKR